MPEVRWEEKNNILEERRWAGGKGSNVARWLRHLGGRPELLIPLGGGSGAELAGYLKRARVSCRIVPLKTPTRVNVIVTSRSGQLRFNPLGPIISPAQSRQLLMQVRGFCRAEKQQSGTPLLICSGALPRGLSHTVYNSMLRVAHQFDITTFLDCDGPAFAAGIRAKPFLVKPNVHELAQWWNRPFDLKRAVRRLSEVTEGWVLVSQGPQGALLWNSQSGIGFSARAPKVQVRNTVGAGDALLAAVAREVQRGAPPEDWLRAGVATATAAVQNQGGQLALRSEMRRFAGSLKLQRLKW